MPSANMCMSGRYETVAGGEQIHLSRLILIIVICMHRGGKEEEEEQVS